MGRWSARLAPVFLDFVALAPGGRVLDVGCGTGVLSRAIRARCADVAVAGIDPAEDLVAHARAQMGEDALGFQVGDALALPFRDASFDGCLSLLILQEFEAPEELVREMRRVTRAGGTVASCQWDFVDGMAMLSLFWDALGEVHPQGVPERRAQGRPPAALDSEAAMSRLWKKGGLTDVRTGTLEITQDFADFEDFWAPFLGGASPSSSVAADLPADVRQTLKETLKGRVLGGRADGPFTLPARAFAVKGRVPG